MKGGFQADGHLENEEIQRADQNIPLNKLTIPGLDWAAIKKKLELPDQYLRTCTLKEGTIITLAIYQTMCIATICVLLMFLIIFPQETEYWWKEKFRNDFDYYYQDENLDIINTLYPLWRLFAYIVIGAHALFFGSGLLSIYALMVKDSHPAWYLPWIIVSTSLSIVHWGICAMQIVTIMALAFYRDISVTWDLVPLSCAIVYGVGWTYSCAVVIAHYKRRCIVRYWKDRQHILGSSDSYPPEITEFLYQYGKGKR